MRNRRFRIAVISLVLLSAVTTVLFVPVDGDGQNGIQEFNNGTSPLLQDTDGDGLSDSVEGRIGTDPLDIDTDNDGLSDYQEYQVSQKFPEVDANPLHKDIILEMDYYYGDKPTDITKDIIEESLSEAPIDNPNGKEGIDVHIITDDAFGDDSPVSKDDYRFHKYPQMHDYGGYGTYHVLIAEHAVESSEYIGWTHSEIDGMLVDDRSTDRQLAALILHETGHQLGLMSSDYVGIDSREKTIYQYPSVMNYNSGSDYTSFSSGQGFDDWEHIEKSMEHTSPSTSNLHNNWTDSEIIHRFAGVIMRILLFLILIGLPAKYIDSIILSRRS